MLVHRVGCPGGEHRGPAAGHFELRRADLEKGQHPMARQLDELHQRPQLGPLVQPVTGLPTLAAGEGQQPPAPLLQHPGHRCLDRPVGLLLELELPHHRGKQGVEVRRREVGLLAIMVPPEPGWAIFTVGCSSCASNYRQANLDRVATVARDRSETAPDQ